MSNEEIINLCVPVMKKLFIDDVVIERLIPRIDEVDKHNLQSYIYLGR